MLTTPMSICWMCFVTQLTNVIRCSGELGRRKEREEEGRREMKGEERSEKEEVRRRVGCALLHNSQMSYAAVMSEKE